MTIFLLSLTLLMLLVIYFDFTSFIIPNWLNGLVLLLYIPFVLAAPEAIDWQGGLIAFTVVFAVGFIIFTFRVMGGGDIKLFIATAPWFGWGQLLLEYFIVIALMGGVLALAVWLFRKALPWILPRTDLSTLPKLLRKDEPIPYGLAISGAFLYLMWEGRIMGLAPTYFL